MARKKNRSLVVLFMDEKDQIEIMGVTYPGQTVENLLGDMQEILRTTMMVRIKEQDEHILPKQAIVIEIVNGSVHRTIEIDRPDPIFFKHLVKEQLK